MESYLSLTQRNIHWIKKAHDSNELVINPPFQRNPVWLRPQKSYLIDSILKGFPIPEIYMQDIVNEHGQAKYIVVDGQQRIRAVLEFLEGEFSLDEDECPEWADLEFDDLNGNDKKKIYEYNFVVRTLPEMPETELRGIFRRINRNTIALNNQELRQATYWGPFIKLMNDLSNEPEWADLRVFSANDLRRMLDVEFISELAIAMLHGFQNKKDNLDKYYQLYEEEFPQRDDLRRSFKRILPELTSLLPNISTSRWRKKSDFYTLFLVFYDHLECLPLTRDQRQRASELLTLFSDALTEFQKSEKPEETEVDKHVVRYATGTRATTDIGERRRRHESLNEFLQEIWC